MGQFGEKVQSSINRALGTMCFDFWHINQSHIRQPAAVTFTAISHKVFLYFLSSSLRIIIIWWLLHLVLKFSFKMDDSTLSTSSRPSTRFSNPIVPKCPSLDQLVRFQQLHFRLRMWFSSIFESKIKIAKPLGNYFILVIFRVKLANNAFSRRNFDSSLCAIGSRPLTPIDRKNVLFFDGHVSMFFLCNFASGFRFWSQNGKKSSFWQNIPGF